MNPRRGEKPPFKSSSRSQSCRGDKSQDGHSRDAACNSALRPGAARRLTSSPPWGGFRWSDILDEFLLGILAPHLACAEHLILCRSELREAKGSTTMQLLVADSHLRP